MTCCHRDPKIEMLASTWLSHLADRRALTELARIGDLTNHPPGTPPAQLAARRSAVLILDDTSQPQAPGHGITTLDIPARYASALHRLLPRINDLDCTPIVAKQACAITPDRSAAPNLD